MKNIISINDLPTTAETGSKFSRQAVMAKRDIKVPLFFCISKAVYSTCTTSIRSSIRYITDRIDFRQQASIISASEAIGLLFEELTIPEGQAQQIYEAFDRMHGKDAIVSVRASTVSDRSGQSEDSATNAFAGMSSSFLYVKREQLLDKIKLCWASGFSTESLIYRQAQGFDVMDFAVAVGVQRMIFGQRSFVMFSCHPETAAKDVLIAAAHGIGEGVVQEAVPIDHYHIRQMDQVITSHIVNKTEQLTFDEEQGYGVKRVAVPFAFRQQPVFSDEVLLELAALARQIEGVFATPQDIEGTIDEKGQIWILQSRPIVFNYDRQLIWTNANVTESFPGVTTALTYSFSKYFYRIIFFDAYLRIGVPYKRIHDNFEMLDRMIGFLKGRVYYCLTHFYLLHRQTPMFPLLAKDWEKMMGFSASYHTRGDGLSAWGRKMKTKLTYYAVLCRNLLQVANHQRNMLKFHHWWERLISPLRGKDFRQTDPLEQVQLFHRVWKEVGEQWGITLMNDTYLPILNGVVNRAFDKAGLTTRYPGLLSELLCGGGRLRSVDIMLSAVALGEYVRNNKDLAARFGAEQDVHALWGEIDRGELDEEFCRRFKYHLHYNGDRGLQELKVEQPSLRDTPWELVKIVKQYAVQQVSEATVRATEQQTRDQAVQVLKSALKGKPIRYRYLLLITGWLRGLIRNRENSRYCRSELFGFSKNIFNALGHYFVKEGILRSADDVYHLAKDEVFGYIDGTGYTEDLQSLADIRRKEFTANKECQTPEQITTMGAVRQNSLVKEAREHQGGSNELKGLPSAAGRVTGIARVITHPTTVEQIHQHEILIARETDPGWLFLMMSARGIIAEKGSMLSHTAITGRKFNIPTIVSVKEVTTRIQDGALIEMDGATGIIRILREKASPEDYDSLKTGQRSAAILQEEVAV